MKSALAVVLPLAVGLSIFFVEFFLLSGITEVFTSDLEESVHQVWPGFWLLFLFLPVMGMASMAGKLGHLQRRGLRPPEPSGGLSDFLTFALGLGQFILVAAAAVGVIFTMIYRVKPTPAVAIIIGVVLVVALVGPLVWFYRYVRGFVDSHTPPVPDWATALPERAWDGLIYVWSVLGIAVVWGSSVGADLVEDSQELSLLLALPAYLLPFLFFYFPYRVPQILITNMTTAHRTTVEPFRWWPHLQWILSVYVGVLVPYWVVG